MFDIPIVEEPEKRSSRRSGIMLCYPFEEKRLATWKAPFIIQPKLDGVRCRAILKDNMAVLVSSENHIIEQVPHINAALVKAFPDMEIELDGELYKHGYSFQEIISVTSRSKNKHMDSESIEYHIFDIVSKGEQIHRTAESNKLGFFSSAQPEIKIVTSSLVRDISEIMDKYNDYIDDGYEGFVIRDSFGEYHRKRYTGIMKFKPHQKDDYLIVGAQEEISMTGNPKGTLGAFICSSSEGTIFNVGTGLTAEQREQYWKDRQSLVGRKLKVKYQALTSGKGVPRFPVVLKVI